jgi:hypothetical protein
MRVRTNGIFDFKVGDHLEWNSEAERSEGRSRRNRLARFTRTWSQVLAMNDVSKIDQSGDLRDGILSTNLAR